MILLGGTAPLGSSGAQATNVSIAATPPIPSAAGGRGVGGSEALEGEEARLASAEADKAQNNITAAALVVGSTPRERERLEDFGEAHGAEGGRGSHTFSPTEKEDASGRENLGG